MQTYVELIHYKAVDICVPYALSINNMAFLRKVCLVCKTNCDCSPVINRLIFVMEVRCGVHEPNFKIQWTLHITLVLGNGFSIRIKCQSGIYFWNLCYDV
jgi:hypothetical protein